MTQNQSCPEWIEVAKAAGAFGVRGFVRVIPVARGDSLRSGIPWSFEDREGSMKILTPETVTSHGAFFLVRFKEIATKEEADLCRGSLFIDRKDFPETKKGEHWAVDLIDFDVVNREGQHLGSLERFLDNGVHDILVVKGTGSKSHLIPMVKSYVLSIDEEKRTIFVDWQEDWS